MYFVPRVLYVLCFYCFFTLSSVSLAQNLDVEEILLNHRESYSQFEDFQATTSLNLKLALGFIPYVENLSGRYFYRKPDQHHLEFDDAPSYFKKVPSVFAWKIPSLKKYKAKVKDPISTAEGTTHQVLFFPKRQSSKTLSITCTFHAKTWHLLQHETAYKDGGSVSLNFTYQKGTKLPILASVKAKVSIPSYSLNGSADLYFSKQKVNQGVDSSLFEKKK